MRPSKNAMSRLRPSGREAVSPVIATILMVAVTVILASVLFVLVLEVADITNDGGKAPGGATPPLPTGSGTPEDPYLIRSLNDVIEIIIDRDAHYALDNDIDASATRFMNNGAGFEPLFPFGDSFRGSMDGKSYNITGLYINRPTSNQVGFFSWIAGDAVIKDVNIINAEVIGQNNVGILAGRSTGIVSDCSTSGTVAGKDNVGGLIGANWRSIERSSSSADVTATGSNIGGLVGLNTNGANRLIIDSYATGAVSGGDTVGGLVGLKESTAKITNCYSIGPVSGSSNVGGLVGTSAGAANTVTSSYWDTTTSGTSTSAAGIGRTNALMKQQSTFTGWDFDEVWMMPPGSYPRLR